MLAAACGPAKLELAVADRAVLEVPRLHLSGRGRQSRDAGGAGAAQGRLAVAAGRRSQGRRTELRRGAQALERVSIRRRQVSATWGSPKKDLDDAANAFRSRDCRQPALRSRARRPRRGAARTRQARDGAQESRGGGRRRSEPRRAAAAASRCCACAVCRTMWPHARKAMEAGRLDEARQVIRPGDRRVARQPVPLSRGGRRRAPSGQSRCGAASGAEGLGARSHRCAGAGTDWRDLRGADRTRSRAVAAYEAALALEPNEAARAQGRGVARRAGAGGAASRVPGDRELVDDLARAAGGARRRAAGRTVQAGAARQRRRDYRYARQLGRALDHVGHARRRDGGLSQSHLPAGGGRPPRRSRRRRRAACCRSSPPRSRRSAPRGRAPKRQFADVPPAHLELPGGVGGGRSRRDAAARGRQLSAVEAGDRRRSRWPR